MKKGILIGGICWTVICVMCAAMFFVFAFVLVPFLAQAIANEGAPKEQVAFFGAYMLSVFVMVGIILLIAAVYSIVLVCLREKKLSKGAGIALGAVGIALGAELPGIFFLIDSIKNR